MIYSYHGVLLSNNKRKQMISVPHGCSKPHWKEKPGAKEYIISYNSI